MGTAAVIAAVDQGTKLLAESRLEPGQRVDVLGDVLGFRLFYNSGAAFSLGTGITPVLTTFACVAVVAMLVALARTSSLTWAAAVGTLLGGAVGNLVDRLFRAPGIGRGEVVDFLELPRWPIFNVADMAVVTGALLIVLLSLRDVPFTTPPGADEAASAEPADAADPAHQVESADHSDDAAQRQSRDL